MGGLLIIGAKPLLPTFMDVAFNLVFGHSSILGDIAFRLAQAH